ncbi:hypothetical protein L3Q82_021381, partial [Scortum barcoo]
SLPPSSLFASPAHPACDFQVLIRLRHYLCDRIKADRHLDYLRSRRILTRDDAEEISCRTTQTKRTATLLDILAENPRGLDALTDSSIREMRTQNFIIAKITDEVQKAKNERLESLRAGASSSSSDSSPLRPELEQRPPHDAVKQLHPALPPGRRAEPLLLGRLVGSLRLASLQKDGADSGAGVSIGVASSTASSTLPKPGDPGAPPLPDEVMVDPPSNLDTAAPGCSSSSSGGDPNFQPLRSRSLTPTSHRSIF